MNKQLKAQAVRLLKMARERIADRSTNYICNAISDSAIANRTSEYIAARTYLHNLIQLRLEGHYSLTSWLRHEGHIVYGQRYETIYDRVRITRLAWIDSLIKEHS